MRLRAWATPFLVVLAAALPTLVTLCELRCVSPGLATEAVPEAPATAACSGHGTEADEKRSSPSESSHDCSGHAILAKSGSVGFDFQLARTFVGLSVVSTAFGFVNSASGHPAIMSVSTDLSPPSGRSSAVLRL